MKQNNTETVDFPTRKSRLGPVMPGAAVLIMLYKLAIVAVFMSGNAHALYQREPVTAYRVANNAIRVDGRPDTLWKAISTLPGGASVISMKDYAKIVLLQPESVRNDNPAKYYPNPVGDSIVMLAAYDNTALYFFFLVKTRSVVRSSEVCAAPADLWKADAPMVFIDPSPWSAAPSEYTSYFSTDLSGLVFGTSPKTVQLAKPLSERDTRFYFRNRATADRFQIPASLPAGVTAVSKARSATDSNTVGVEMKIPFWGGDNSAFAPGSSMFISWGFSFYPDSLWGSCGANPIAYRWAKHYLNYDAAAVKPPGWRVNDSTHYDPVRSWDGWGRFALDVRIVSASDCLLLTDTTSWSLSDWRNGCNPPTTSAIAAADRSSPHSVPGGSRARLQSGPGGRDLRGRSTASGSPLLIFPWKDVEARGLNQPGKGSPDESGRDVRAN